MEAGEGRGVMDGWFACRRSMSRAMVPLADRIKGSLPLLAEESPNRFIMVIAEELDNRKHRIEELERLVDLLLEEDD